MCSRLTSGRIRWTEESAQKDLSIGWINLMLPVAHGHFKVVHAPGTVSRKASSVNEFIVKLAVFIMLIIICSRSTALHFTSLCIYSSHSIR